MILDQPTLSAIDYAVSSLSVTASKAECQSLIKAQMALHEGLVICAVPGAFLVRSFTSGAVYRIDHTTGCDCAARVKPCKHMWAIRCIEEARNARPSMPRLTKTRAEAATLMGELFA